MSDFFNLIDNPNRKARNLLVLGIPWDKSSSYRFGSVQGPDYIRKSTSSKVYNSFTETGTDLNQRWNIIDLGNVDTEVKDLDEIIDNIRYRLNQYRKEEPILFLGGDHLVTYLCMHAINPSTTGIIYFDAHPDLYNEYEGDKYSHACVIRRILDNTQINPQDIVQIGIRASTKEQNDFSRENGVLVFSRKDVQYLGYDTIVTRIKEKLNHLEQIYISIDLDVLDPANAPGVGNPEPAGLSMSNIVDLIHELSGLPIKFFDIVEINPSKDISNITGFAAAKIIKEMFGIIP